MARFPDPGNLGARSVGPPPNYVARRILVVGIAVAVIGGVAGPFVLGAPRIEFEGVEEGASLHPDALSVMELQVRIEPESALDDAVVRLDGEEIDTTRDGDRLRIGPSDLAPGTAEGDHVLTVRAGGRRLWRGPSNASLHFAVDSTPPVIEVMPDDGEHPVDQPLRISGRTEPGSDVTVMGEAADVDSEGGFTVTLPRPPIGQLDIVAVDAAGNVGAGRANSGVTLPDIRAVHVSSVAWTVARLRDPVLEMADQGLINAVQLDLKDEDGIVGHRTDVGLAADLGASAGHYDLATVVDDIHSRGLRVVGRIVVFRDPLLTAAAASAGNLDALVLTEDGAPYKGSYGGFANPASDGVTAYNRDLAVEAAEAGVDDILFDYIRRPEGPLDSMQFPGSEGPIEDHIIDFLVEVGDALADTPSRLGVSVFGIAAKNPEEIAQPVDRMAREVDYIAPMVYPSHWGSGWYGVDDPDGQPYDIVSGALRPLPGEGGGDRRQDRALAPGLRPRAALRRCTGERSDPGRRGSRPGRLADVGPQRDLSLRRSRPSLGSDAMEWSIDGRKVLITGGKHGIGQATAEELARRGARVTITAFAHRFVTDDDPLDVVVNNAGSHGGGATGDPRWERVDVRGQPPRAVPCHRSADRSPGVECAGSRHHAQLPNPQVPQERPRPR